MVTTPEPAPPAAVAADDCSTIEVARLLGMAVRSVQLMVDRGELQAWRTPGGHRRISRASVQNWLASRQAAPAAGGVTGSAAAGGPASTSAPAAAAIAAPTGPRAAPTRPAPPPGTTAPGATAAMKVLLIEDSSHYQHLIELLVRQHLPDAELHVADDGIAGLALAGRLDPDLLIVDILLPGIDGPTLITSLRRHPQFARSRLLVVTSLDDVQREPYAFALAGLPVVHKTRLVNELPALLAAAATGAAR